MVGNRESETTFHMILLISLKTSFLIIFLSFFIVCYFSVALDTRGGPPHALSLLFTNQQGCYGLQKQLTIYNFPDTVQKPCGWKAACKYHICNIAVNVFGREIIA
jgi:hypothetical protein